MASRWAVTTAMRGDSPAPVSASSSSRRLDVPGGAAMNGTLPSSATASPAGPSGARRQDDQQPLPGEFMSGESGGECGALGKPELTLAALQQFRQVRGVFGGGEINEHSGMAGAEPADQSSQRVGGECREAAEGERAGDQAGY